MLVNDFLDYVSKNKLFSLKDKILLAFSGGVDSVVLSHLLWQTQHCFALAHVNFGLRGEASAADARWAAAWAQQMGVPFFLYEVQPKTRISGNIQLWARQLRYAWLEALRQQKGYDYIATAHHADDVLETVLLQLIRGGGIGALHGIYARRAYLRRPLLFATRQQIEAYAHQQALSWREDSSNQADYYRRNRIRHHVVPLLRQMNPNIAINTLELTERIQDIEQVWLQYVEQHRNSAVTRLSDEGWCIDTQQLPSHRRALWHAILAPWGVSYRLSCQIAESVGKGQSGSRFSTRSYELLLDRHRLLIRPHQAAIQAERIQLPITEADEDGQCSIGDNKLLWCWQPAGKVNYSLADAQTAYLACENLCFPLYVRRWQPGDWFCPLGMGGKRKKLSDFFVNAKLSVFDKQQQWLLTDNQDRIVWVVGYRIDERFAIRPSTQKVLCLTWLLNANL